MKIVRVLLVLAISIALPFYSSGQDPERFKEDIKDILRTHQANYNKGDLIIFAGSSSVRLWPDLPGYFPEHNVVNHGFGGSHMSDLLYYSAPLITSLKPATVFIYEGDNDIAGGKSADSILVQTDSLISVIRNTCPDTRIVFLCPKPSPSRWHLKTEYLEYNQKLKALCEDEGIVYLDTWSGLLTESGIPNPEFYTTDDLHMTSAGYQMWLKVILPVLNQD